jgi:hypothetical protein
MSINNAECPECGRGFARWDKKDPKTCPGCTIKLQQDEIDRLTAEVVKLEKDKFEIAKYAGGQKMLYEGALDMVMEQMENAGQAKNESYRLGQDLTDLACLYERLRIDSDKQILNYFYQMADTDGKLYDVEVENAKLREALSQIGESLNRIYKRADSHVHNIQWIEDINLLKEIALSTKRVSDFARAARGEE